MLTAVLVLAAIGVLMSAVMLTVDPTPIAGLGVGQRQDAETGLYVAAFFIFLPVALVLVPRLADRIARGPNADGLAALAALLAAGLVVAVLVARLADLVGIVSSGFDALAPALVVWWVVAGAAIARATRPKPWPLLLRAAPRTGWLWIAAAVMAGVSTLAVTDLTSVDPLGLVLALLVAAGVVWFAERMRSRAPSHGRWWLLVDAAAIGLVLLAIPDMVVHTPEAPNQGLLDSLITGVMQLHHNFILGPANQVTGGDALLVDTGSQYGVGSTLFVAGWFKVVPIGYGTFALLDGILSALFFAAGYVLLRLVGVSRLASAGTLAVAIVVLVFNRTYPVGLIPQEGPLRFGLPLLVVLAAVAAERRPGQARIWLGVEAAVLGISAVWAFEAFALTAATWLALVALRVWLAPAGQRRRRGVRLVAIGAAACVVAHVAFALYTLAISGELPDWGQYWAFLNAFLFGDLGDLTYDYAPWTGALLVGAAQLVSGAALVLLVMRRAALVREQRVLFTALTGLTAYGVVQYDYFVNRSADHVLPYVSLPLLLSGVLWIRLLRMQPGVPRALRTGSLVLPLAVMALLVGVAWSSIGPRFGDSALAYAVPRHKSLNDALHRLWNFPPLDTSSPQAEALLAKDMPGQKRVPVLIKPGLQTEVLMRSKRVNAIPIGEPWEDGFVADTREPGIRKAIAGMPAGQRILLDQGSLQALDRIRRNPGLDPFDFKAATPAPGSPTDKSTPGSPTAPIQVYALEEINRRFKLRIVDRGPGGFVVAELQPR